MTTEAKFQAYVCKKCSDYGILVYKFESPARRGVPDLLLVFPGGEIVFLELKNPAGTGRLSKLQLVEINRLRHQGATVYVVDSKDRFHEIVASRLNPGTAGSD
jgi:hypothetical protein